MRFGSETGEAGTTAILNFLLGHRDDRALSSATETRASKPQPRSGLNSQPR
jgi:hypothetical protein